jgi:ArsR family transcriptional regulator, arsenate/arsenite/antimonite-responsive transcriptional repressor
MSAPAVNRMFRAFSDRTRLRILHLLLKSEMCVCDIVAVTRVPQPTVSRHLAHLRKAGLVLGRKDGLWNYYRLASAESPFHRSLIKCLKECFRDVPELASDAKRASKASICRIPVRKA